jgi:hypothetical protein
LFGAGPEVAVAATQSGTETVDMVAGSLLISGCGTCAASVSVPIGQGGASAPAPTATWTDATGSGAGWNGTVATTAFTYTGEWSQVSGASAALGALSGGHFRGGADGVTYLVRVLAGGTASATPFAWTSTDPADMGGGTSMSVNGTVTDVGSQGASIMFAAGAAYVAGTTYEARMGAMPTDALHLDPVVAPAVVPEAGTTAPSPQPANMGSTVQAGGPAVKFVSAVEGTGMGSYSITPAVFVSPDASSWAADYEATLTYSMVSGP